MADKTECEAGHDAQQAIEGNRVAAEAAASCVIVPDGYTIASLEKFSANPDRPRSAIRVNTAAAMVAYLTRFGDSRCVAFADADSATIKAVLDYHTPHGVAGWGGHVCTFRAEHTAQWDAWISKASNRMSQLEFGRFLEERARDIVQPEAAAVVEVAMNMEAIKKVSFKSSQRLSDGYRQFSFVEEDQSNGAIRVPEIVTVDIPVYEGGRNIKINLRLRWRHDSGSVSFWLAADNAKDIAATEFIGLVNKVSSMTKFSDGSQVSMFEGSI